MVHDPEMKKAGDVIFVPDEQEHENEGLHYRGTTQASFNLLLGIYGRGQEKQQSESNFS